MKIEKISLKSFGQSLCLFNDFLLIVTESSLIFVKTDSHVIEKEMSLDHSIHHLAICQNQIYALSENKLLLINPDSKEVITLFIGEEEFNDLLFIPKNFFSLIDDDGNVFLFEQMDQKLIPISSHNANNKHENIGMALCVLEKRSKQFISAGMDYKIKHWDFSSHQNRLIDSFDIRSLDFSLPDLPGYLLNPPFIHSLASFDDGFFAGLGNGFIVCFQPEKRNHKLQKWKKTLMKYHSLAVTILKINGQHLFSAGDDGKVSIWDIKTKSLNREISLKQESASFKISGLEVVKKKLFISTYSTPNLYSISLEE